ncbi:asparagine synthase-domain-containing protein [Nemania sp. FL0031]|nr:asparagine synthase-domain-containing protein [Nemania sp. FL0031]
MCGIHATITASTDSGLSPELRQSLVNRGPDHLGQAQREIPCPDSDQTLRLYFTSTVLALRGDHIAKQPLEENSGVGSVLCWNGEAWRINGQLVSGNDGEAIFSMLQSSTSSTSSTSSSNQDREAHIVDVLRSIEGPFAFVYYDSPASRVYYGRDRLGRRSLLIKRSSESPSITLSSIASVPTTGWEEVSSEGIWSVDLKAPDSSTSELSFQNHVTKLAWLPASNQEMVSSIGVFNHELPSSKHELDFTSPSLQILRHKLIESLKPRVLDVPEPPNAGSDIDVRIAILFSGGLDCTVLARLAHELMPISQGIDLINVAFQNPRQVALQAKQPHLQASDIYESCPDRATGRKAFAELQSSCPGRYWRFIAVNVPFEEAMTHKAKVLSLIYPHDTEMDLSIAFALYFAARGTGDCYVDQIEWQPSPPVTSTSARVLLSGLGADELFGGYSRHEAAFKRSGYSGLIDELKLDVSRIGQRNLGRDDRIMAHWGREVRFPYLDEEFFRFAIGSPVWEKCDFENTFHPAVIDPAKRILRLLADQLDLPTTARQKKRAIQFGSRTAKIESATGRLRGTAQVST